MKKRSNNVIAALKKLKARDKTKRQAAIAEVCLAFEPLVKSQAVRYTLNGRFGADREELEQVARVGLLEACASFNAKLGAFPTHATWCIRHALAEYIAGLPNPIRLPSDIVRRVPKLQRIITEMARALKRHPTIDELAAEMKLAPAVIAMMEIYDSGPESLDDAEPANQDRFGRRPAKVERFPSATGSPEEILIAEEDAKAVARQKGNA